MNQNNIEMKRNIEIYSLTDEFDKEKDGFSIRIETGKYAGVEVYLSEFDIKDAEDGTGDGFLVWDYKILSYTESVSESEVGQEFEQVLADIIMEALTRKIYEDEAGRNYSERTDT